MALDVQLTLPLAPRTWGGARHGAGRKPSGRTRVPHGPRPAHRRQHPVHVTLRARAGLPPFREQALFGAIEGAIAAASRSPAVGEAYRIVHFSVQTNHLHLIVEADDRSSLTRGTLGLEVRLARAINGVLRVRGKVWRERYHARALEGPREVRNAIVYVLMNARKHGVAIVSRDPFSSAPWFDGFADDDARPPGAAPTAQPRTWLASVGWRARGRVRFDERPRRANKSAARIFAPGLKGSSP